MSFLYIFLDSFQIVLNWHSSIPNCALYFPSSDLFRIWNIFSDSIIAKCCLISIWSLSNISWHFCRIRIRIKQLFMLLNRNWWLVSNWAQIMLLIISKIYLCSSWVLNFLWLNFCGRPGFKSSQIYSRQVAAPFFILFRLIFKPSYIVSNGRKVAIVADIRPGRFRHPRHIWFSSRRIIYIMIRSLVPHIVAKFTLSFKMKITAPNRGLVSWLLIVLKKIHLPLWRQFVRLLGLTFFVLRDRRLRLISFTRSCSATLISGSFLRVICSSLSGLGVTADW